MSALPFALRADDPDPSARGNTDPLGKHADELRSFLARRLRLCDADIDDILQDVRIRVWLLGGSFPTDGGLRAWLFCIAKRIAITRFRSEARRSSRQHEYAARLARHVPGRHEWAAEAWAAAVEQLAMLPDDLRVILELHCLDGATYQALAELCGLTMSEVRGRVRKALNLLCGLLGDFSP